MKIQFNAKEYVRVLDGARVTHTYIGLEDVNGNAAVVEVEGADALIQLAQVLLDRAEDVRACEQAAERHVATRIARLSGRR